MRKVNVIGTSGTGKTTLAIALAERLGCPVIHMDALFWKPGWRESEDEEFFAKLEKALCCDRWVLDGNYSRSQPVKWKDVDTIIWLDFSFVRTFMQALKRAIGRIWTQKELWPDTGNRESLRLLFSRHSIILWTLRMYPKNKKRYANLMNDPQYAHITFVRLQSPSECRTFIESARTD